MYWWWDIDIQQLGLDTFNNAQQGWNFGVIEDSSTEFSLFADVAYTFDLGNAGELEINGGIRRYDLEDSYHDISSGIWSEGQTIVAGQEDGNRYKFSASYRPSDDLSVYALYSEGYRPGGNNGPLPQSCSGDPKAGDKKDRYTSDAIENYELGLKASTFEGAFSFAVAVYQIDWTDIKTDIYMDTCGFDYTANAGAAQSQGFEFESTAQLTDALTMTCNTSYTSSELTEDNEAIDGEKGDKMTMVPDWNGYLALDQGFEAFGKQAFVRADYTYYGSYKTHFDTRPEDVVPAYSYVNLSSRVELTDAVTLSVHLNNVFDADAIKYKNARSRDAGYTDAQQYIEFLSERNLTVRVDYTFF
jgi:outer membrane receptor protein involved in Fe transport